MTGGRINRWRMPLLLAVVCLALGGLLAWQLSAPPPQAGPSPAVVTDDPAERRAGETEDGLDADAEGEADAGADAEIDSGDAAAAAGGDFTLPPLAEFSAIVERPLFIRGRRPAPPVSDVATTSATDEGRSPFLLSGVMIAGGRRVALLQTRASPKSIRVEEGETVEGWKVIAIRPQGVTVASGANRDELKLPDRIGAPPPVAAPPRQPPRTPGVDHTRNPNQPPPPTLPPGRPSEQAPGTEIEQE